MDSVVGAAFVLFGRGLPRRACSFPWRFNYGSFQIDPILGNRGTVGVVCLQAHIQFQGLLDLFWQSRRVLPLGRSPILVSCAWGCSTITDRSRTFRAPFMVHLDLIGRARTDRVPYLFGSKVRPRLLSDALMKVSSGVGLCSHEWTGSHRVDDSILPPSRECGGLECPGCFRGCDWRGLLPLGPILRADIRFPIGGGCGLVVGI